MRLIHLVSGCLSAVLGGMLIYALLHEIIIIRIPTHHTALTEKRTKKQSIVLHIWNHGIQKTEHRTVLYRNDDLENVRSIITLYWELLEEEQIIGTKPVIQAVTTDMHAKTVICSLATSPFNADASAYESWLIVEGLCATIRANTPRYQYLWLLINHETYHHAQLDLHNPWPLEGFESLLYTQKNNPQRIDQSARIVECNNPVIILDPAGDSRSIGRTIHDTFERSVTLQIAEYIRQEYTKEHDDSRLRITRSVGEVHDQHQRATFANCSRADIYIHISAYATHEEHPLCTIYTYRTHPTTDLWRREPNPMAFIPYYEAHLNHCATSERIAQRLYQKLTTIRPCPIVTTACVGFPYAPMRGITIPAVGIELGIPKQYDLKAIAALLTSIIMQ